MTGIPRQIWTWWEQGYENAPEIAAASCASWRRLNPGWQVHALDLKSLGEFLPQPEIERIFSVPKEREAISDQIRIELLAKHGGVWADATTICIEPLDDWLPRHSAAGFFAFERPSDFRALASWFLAGEPNNYLVKAWRERVVSYWNEHTKRDDYFWFHRQFETLLKVDDRFGKLWDTVVKLPAKHDFHFGSNDADKLLAPPTAAYLEQLSNPPSPVFKLTHKLGAEPTADSLFSVLCRVARGASAPPP